MLSISKGGMGRLATFDGEAILAARRDTPSDIPPNLPF